MEGIDARVKQGGRSAPLREQLLTVPDEDRSDLMVDRLRCGLAEALGTNPDRLPADRPLSELAPPSADPLAFYRAVQLLVREQLGFLVFPVELTQRPTLRHLAEYLVEEALPAAWPEPKPWDDLYAGGRWAWRLPPLPADAERSPTAVFVLSAPRSGSTLFRTMLAGHPALFSPPELNLLPFDRMGDRGRQIDRLGYTWMRSGPGTALAKVEGLAPESIAARLAELESEDVPVREVYRTLQEGAGGRLLVDKSPIYATHPDILARAEALFESPRFLVLTRHPLSVMESFVRMRFHRLLGNHWLVWDENPWVFGEKFWTSSYRHILQLTARVDPKRCHRISYEALVTEPERVLDGVSRFLGIPYDPAMTRPYEGDRMLRHPADRRIPSIGDPNLLSHRGLDPALAESWKRVHPPQPLADPTLRLAVELGYDL
jgi:hypothetical protein